MAAIGCMEAKGSAGELNNLLTAKTLLEKGVFDHAFNFDQNSTLRPKQKEQCLNRRWNGSYHPAAATTVEIVNLLQQKPSPLTLHAAIPSDIKHQQNCVFRRTLRIERAASTESVVAISGGESCQSSSIASDSASEPSSPSRPVTPQPMPPVPAHLTDHCRYECLRADSEDSGLGPSPAKSSMGPTSPLEGYVSPIQFVPEAEDEDDDDDGPNTLLDLTTCRGKASYISCKEDSFLPYTVSKLIGQDENLTSLCQRANGRKDSFHFCLPRVTSQDVINGLECEDRSSPDIPQTCDLEQSARNALDFQFLMTSKSVVGNSSESLDGVVVALDSKCRKAAELPAPSEEDCGPGLLLSSPASSSSSGEKVEGSLPQSPSACVTKVDLNAKYSSSSNLSPRHKVPPLEDDVKSESVRPQFTARESNKRDLDGDESRQSSCGDTSQDRSEMCHELTSDCTSSSCSQVTNDTQSSGGVPDNTCKWLNCDQRADANATSSDLVDHLRKCHIQTQFDDATSYVCLWVGCKVYERPSSSRSWLDRHVLLHGGNKPFQCIVDGCHQRFGTEGALQRHVNSHFPQRNGKNGPHGENHAGGPGGGGGPNGRLLKRKKHHKYRRRPHSVKTNDFFDDGIMEQVRHSLLELSSIEGMDRAGPPAAITFHSTVIARRTEDSGKAKLLLHWDPEDLLPDIWVAEEDAPSNVQKTIPIASLPPDALVHLDPLYTARLLPRPGKRRRKWIPA